MGKTAILAVKIISDAKNAVGGIEKTDLAIGSLVVGAVALGKHMVNAFTDAAGGVSRWQRIVGGSVEDASRLNFAVRQSGVDADKSLSGFGRFEKALSTASATGKGTKTMTELLGGAFTDAKGKLLPMNQILPALMDKFQAMPAGPERTALAMKLFGKSGADMLPFLAKGSAGLSELSAKSDKYGHTLSGKHLDALKQSKLAQRDWGSAVDGFQVQFGAQLLPMITAGVTLLTGQLVPAITSSTQWMMHNQDAVALIIGVAGTLIGIVKTITMLSKAWAAVQVALNIAMSANPIGLVVLAIAALVGGFLYLWNTNKGFRDFFIGAWAAITAAAAAVSAWFTDVFLPANVALWNLITKPVVEFWRKFSAGWNSTVAFATGIPRRILAAIVGMGTLLIARGKALIDGLRTGAVNTWSTVTGWLAGMPRRIVAAVGNAMNWLKSTGGNIVAGLWRGISAGYSWITSKIREWVGNVMDFFKRLFVGNSANATGSQYVRSLGQGVTSNRAALLTPLRNLSAAAEAAFAPQLTMTGPGVAAPRLSPVTSSYGLAALRPVVIHIHGAIDRRATAREIRAILTDDARSRCAVTIDEQVI